MSNLKTKREEIVLEQFFKEYITAWYQERTVDVHTWDKARKEIELLKGKKMAVRKQKDLPTNRDDDILAVKALPDNSASTPRPTKAKPHVRPTSAMSESAKSSSKGQRPQHKEGRQNKQAFTKEEIEIQRNRAENFELENKVSDLKEMVRSLRAEAYIEINKRDDQLEKLSKAFENSKEQIQDLTLRLSKLAGDKLRQGNPDLADLSDPNRPTELGKKFSEVYDNEWSDAFENIPTKEEEKKVGMLHGIVMKAHSFCSQKFEDQTNQVRAVLLGLAEGTDPEAHPQKPNPGNGDKTIRTSKIHNSLKDLRKEMVHETAENVAKVFVSTRLDPFLSGFQIDRKKIHVTLRNYASKCAELCWFMAASDPPLVLSDEKEGEVFNTNVYKPYTKSVKDMKKPIVDLRVWPALLLQATGPLVAKGVAQPKEGKTK